MTGVSFTRGGYHRIGKRVTNGAGGYTVYRPGHWVFDGTGIDYGDVLGARATTVGYECDGCEYTVVDGLPEPTGSDGTPVSFEILAMVPAAHHRRAATQAERAVRDRVPCVTCVRRPERRRREAHRCRSGDARQLHVTRRGHGDHVRLDRLGTRARRPRRSNRADHHEHSRPPRLSRARQRARSGVQTVPEP